MLAPKSNDNPDTIKTARPNRSSVFSQSKKKTLSEWVVYGRIQQHSNNSIKSEEATEKLSLSIVSELIDTSQIPEHCQKLLRNSKFF